MASKNNKKKNKATKKNTKKNTKIKSTNSTKNKKTVNKKEKNPIIRKEKTLIKNEKISKNDTKQEEMFNILDDEKKNILKKDRKKVLIILLVISLILNVCSACYFLINNKQKVKIKKVVKTEYKVPENIVFLGDSITDFYDLKKYYPEYNIVNSGISGNITTDILNNMEERVYRYNPSKVFLLIGINDLAREIPKDEIVSNIEKITKEIKENRPETEIYVESIYPINDSDDEKIYHPILVNRNNEDVVEVNTEIKKYCKENRIEYIDLYSELIDEDKNLKLEYTNEGLHISDEGYEFITKELKKYLK